MRTVKLLILLLSFATISALGQQPDYEAIKRPNRLKWGFTLPQGEIRYILDFSAADKWVELGEFSPDGSQWFQFMEMNLKRRKD